MLLLNAKAALVPTLQCMCFSFVQVINVRISISNIIVIIPTDETVDDQNLSVNLHVPEIIIPISQIEMKTGQQGGIDESYGRDLSIKVENVVSQSEDADDWKVRRFFKTNKAMCDGDVFGCCV